MLPTVSLSAVHTHMRTHTHCRNAGMRPSCMLLRVSQTCTDQKSFDWVHLLGKQQPQQQQQWHQPDIVLTAFFQKKWWRNEYTHKNIWVTATFFGSFLSGRTSWWRALVKVLFIMAEELVFAPRLFCCVPRLFKQLAQKWREHWVCWFHDGQGNSFQQLHRFIILLWYDVF